jgi:hypothetical protein
VKLHRVSKSECLRALRTMFGPTVRIAHIQRAGIDGVQVLRGDKVMLQTFDMADGVWRRLVRGTIHLWRHDATAAA